MSRVRILITLFILGVSTCGFADSDLFLNSAEMPTVLTATRLQQAPAAAPGSVTILDNQLIKQTGARDIAELMTLVPGMMLNPKTRHDIDVNYHSNAPGHQRRIQVLVDGRAVYRSVFAQVDWLEIPVAIEDIERIEVFRGPNTVTYGANAMMAVVNIFTNQAHLAQGSRVKVSQTLDGASTRYIRQGNNWETGGAWLSLSSQKESSHANAATSLKDGSRLSRMQFRLAQDLNPRQNIDLQVAASEGSFQQASTYESPTQEKVPLDLVNNRADKKHKDYAASVQWNFDISDLHTLSVQGNALHWVRLQNFQLCDSPSAYIHTEFLNLNADYICGTAQRNSRESRYDIEIQDTYAFSQGFRLVSGGSYREDFVKSDTFFKGVEAKRTSRAFGQFEWMATQHWLFQGGAMYESDNYNKDSVTPRASVNYLFTPNHSVRAVYSEAIRSPDMFENHVKWHYKVKNRFSNLGPVKNDYLTAHAYGPGNLEQERMHSYEIGYNGYFEKAGLNFDLKFYHDEIRKLLQSNHDINQFYSYNGGSLLLRGMEFEANWQVNTQDRLRSTYAYSRTSEPKTHHSFPTFTPKHSGSISWLRDWGQSWSTHLNYIGAAKVNNSNIHFAQLYLGKAMHWNQQTLTLSGTVQKILNDPSSLSKDAYLRNRQQFIFSADWEF